jgi:hypothetical protein
MLCQYKNILGVPSKGIHSYRFFNIAVADVILTFLGAYFIKLLIFKQCSYWIILFLFFILGIILHKLFCVQTTIDKLIFH